MSSCCCYVSVGRFFTGMYRDGRDVRDIWLPAFLGFGGELTRRRWGTWRRKGQMGVGQQGSVAFAG